MSETTAAPVTVSSPEYTEAQATKAFSASVMISGVRCLFAYVLLPWVLPALGIAGDWGPWLGLIVGPIAIVFNGLSIRRFQASGHRWRWPITAINVSIIGLLVVLMVQDIATLVS